MLAALLLRRDEVVPVERLFDEVWGDDPPASAAHSLESYVSRLRRALSPYGVAVERRGGGYRIDLGGAVLDSQVFEALVDQAAQALAAGDHPRAASRREGGTRPLARPCPRGRDAAPGGRAEAERLDELRSRAFEIRVDADLALGRHGELVGELRRLVEETPYRERLVAQLMVALYRSGRHVEALDVYERTRRDLETISGSGRARSFSASRGRSSARSLSFGAGPAGASPRRSADAADESSETVRDCPRGSTGRRRDGDCSPPSS